MRGGTERQNNEKGKERREKRGIEGRTTKRKGQGGTAGEKGGSPKVISKSVPTLARNT